MRHPINRLGDRLGREWSALVVLSVVAVVVEVVEGRGRVLAFGVILAGVLVGTAAWERSRREDDADALRDARSDYVEGDITLSEFESRLDVVLDERAVAIRERVEQVDGVGPETSASIAQAFATVEDVETATRDDLLDVYGVGPVTADDLVREVVAPEPDPVEDDDPDDACPHCGAPTQYFWDDGSRVCVDGHRWEVEDVDDQDDDRRVAA